MAKISAFLFGVALMLTPIKVELHVFIFALVFVVYLFKSEIFNEY